MAKMDNGTIAIFLVVIVAAALLAGGYFSAVGGTGTATKVGTCPDDGLVDVRMAAINKDDLTNKAQVAVNASVFLKGGFTPIDTIVTSASGYNTSSNVLECSQDYIVVFGYNMTTYYQTIVQGLNTGQATINTIDGAGSGLAEKVGAITITGANSSVSGGAAGINVTMGAGGSNNEVVLHIAETTAKARFGQGDIMVCSLYNNTNISSVVFAGVEVDQPSFLTGSQECYKMPATLVGNTQFMDIRPIITAVDGANPAADNVVITVMDYFNYYHNGEVKPLVQHPTDKTAYGATDVAFTISIN